MKQHYYSQHAGALRAELGAAIPRDAMRELHRKEKALAETAALLVLRKKLNDYWGIDNEDN